jgi:hypothetical protein
MSTTDDEIACNLPLAARGDVDAQARLVHLAYEQFRNGVVTYSQAVQVAEVWARLAAEHGRPADVRALVLVLCDIALLSVAIDERDEAAARVTEATVLLDELADNGDDQAGGMLLRLHDLIGPTAMQAVTAGIRELRTDQEGEG